MVCDFAVDESEYNLFLAKSSSCLTETGWAIRKVRCQLSAKQVTAFRDFLKTEENCKMSYVYSLGGRGVGIFLESFYVLSVL